jgi:hypothetical protein
MAKGGVYARFDDIPGAKQRSQLRFLLGEAGGA